jgi:hypothetical protein
VQYNLPISMREAKPGRTEHAPIGMYQIGEEEIPDIPPGIYRLKIRGESSILGRENSSTLQSENSKNHQLMGFIDNFPTKLSLSRKSSSNSLLRQSSTVESLILALEARFYMEKFQMHDPAKPVFMPRIETSNSFCIEN